MKTTISSSSDGITLIEVIIVLLLLSISFGVFLEGLNSSKIVKATSEFRIKQAVILNDIQQQIRARRFDEKMAPPWSLSMGTDLSYNLSFDGNNDYIEIPSDIVSNQITIGFWFKPTQSNWDGVIFDASKGDKYFYVEGTNSQMRWFFEDKDDRDLQISVPYNFNQNQWHHVVAVGSLYGNTQRLYIDGSLVASSSINMAGIPSSGFNHLKIGTEAQSYGTTYSNYEGLLEKFSIWDEVLESNEILELYNSGSGLDPTVNYGNYSSSFNLIAYWKMREGAGATVYDESINNYSGTLIGNPAWTSSGSPAENSIELWDDIDDFNNYSIASIPDYPNFSYSVSVHYVDASTNFHTVSNSITNYKSVIVKIDHPSISSMTDTMIISQGF